jgi:hypothetical protein
MSKVDLIELSFTGLMWFSFVCFLVSALIMKQIEATLSTGLIMVLSITAIHERRLRRLENEVEKEA